MEAQLNYQTSIRERVLKSVSLIIAMFVGVVALVNLSLSNNYILASIEASISGLFVFIFYKVHKRHPLTWQPPAVALLITSGLLFGFSSAPEHFDIIFWAYPLPALYQLFFSRSAGALSTFAMLGAVIIIYYPEAISHFEVSRSLINFMLPYIMIWAVAYNHEGVHLSIQKELANLARIDNLTGCLNRRALTQDWNNISQHTGQYLLHIDLDNFKTINDCYGHEAGDLALKTFTSVAQRVLKNSQCYRVGGEEFCLLFRADSNNDALELSQNLGLTLRETTIHLSNSDINITLSGGLLPLADNEVWPLDVAIKAADEATYQAKNTGKNRIVFCQNAKDN